jgi:hypothetical protein
MHRFSLQIGLRIGLAALLFALSSQSAFAC